MPRLSAPRSKPPIPDRYDVISTVLKSERAKYKKLVEACKSAEAHMGWLPCPVKEALLALDAAEKEKP